MNFTADPIPVAPSTTSIPPAITRAHEEAVDAMFRDDSGNDDDERSCRAADLKTRATQQRNESSGDYGGVDARLRRQS